MPVADASVSMVQMQDSMQFDDPKAFTNNLGSKNVINGTLESRSPDTRTIIPSTSAGDGEDEYDRTSSGHYMKMEEQSFGGAN